VTFETTTFLLSDTVGFIRKLPTFLIEAFKSTLDEVREADVLMHVVDISHPNFEDQIKVVNQTLAELKVTDKATILVFNKADAFHFHDEDGNELLTTIDELKNSWIAKEHKESVFISAVGKQNINELRAVMLNKIRREYGIRYPYSIV
jgi:GTP-binding protein HflX